jgi:hypothetical protein
VRLLLCDCTWALLSLAAFTAGNDCSWMSSRGELGSRHSSGGSVEKALENHSGIRWPSPLSFPDEELEDDYQSYSAASFFKLSFLQHALGLSIIVVLLCAHVTGFSSRPIFSSSNWSMALTMASFFVHLGCVLIMILRPAEYMRKGVWETLTALSRLCIIAAGRDLYVCPECQGGFGSLSTTRALMNGSYFALTFVVTVGEPLPFMLHVIVQGALLVLTLSGNAHMCSLLSAEPRIIEELQKTAKALLPPVHRLLWYPVGPPDLYRDYLQISCAVTCQALLASAQLLWQAFCVAVSFYWEVSLRRSYLRWKYPNDRNVRKWPLGFSHLMTLCIFEFPVMLLLGCCVVWNVIYIYGLSIGWSNSCSKSSWFDRLSCS